MMRSLFVEISQAILLGEVDVDFAMRQISCLPIILRLGAAAMCTAFVAHAIIRCGKRFGIQGVAQRREQLAAWRDSKIGPCRDFVALCEGLLWYSYINHKARS